MPIIQDEILAQFADARVFTQCPSCPDLKAPTSSSSSSTQSPFRCTDCGYLPPCCIVRRHRYQPFHRIEEWSSGFFHRCNNAELGIGLYLGHAGAPCPHLPKEPPSKRMTIQDENVIHEVKIYFCQCPSRPSFFQQLLQFRILAATVDEPQIGFTFASLHNFNIHMTTSKKSAHDHCIALRRLTDYAFPDDVKVKASESLNPKSKFSHTDRTSIVNSFEYIAYGTFSPFNALKGNVTTWTQWSRIADQVRCLCIVPLARSLDSTSRLNISEAFHRKNCKLG
jgi:hypothetical protein